MSRQPGGRRPLGAGWPAALVLTLLHAAPVAFVLSKIIGA